MSTEDRLIAIKRDWLIDQADVLDESLQRLEQIEAAAAKLLEGPDQVWVRALARNTRNALADLLIGLAAAGVPVPQMPQGCGERRSGSGGGS